MFELILEMKKFDQIQRDLVKKKQYFALSAYSKHKK
jgi:hypothetical protein